MGEKRQLSHVEESQIHYVVGERTAQSLSIAYA